MPPRRVVVRLTPGCSDGDPLHVPTPGTHSQINPPTLYLEKVAQEWMKQRGEAQPGVQYILEALPAGYTMWHRPRPSDPKCFDKYLYGHPNHKKFDSPNRFYPHFEHLMNNSGNSIGCPCTVCKGGSGVLPRNAPNTSRQRSSSTASSSRLSNASASAPAPVVILRSHHPHEKHDGQTTPRVFPGRPNKLSPGLDMSSIDQDGTPEVYRNLIEKLKTDKQIDQTIREPLSPDWRAEQERLPKLLQTLKTQEQWIPRNGDIVLFVRDLADIADELSGQLQWEAGLVTEAAPAPSLTDLVELAEKPNVSCSGIRVEPIPNPNNADKSLSKRYKYISLRQSRPFFLWKELLHKTDQDYWHPTIKNALALTSTISLMGKYRFRGTWPEATIYCHGIFIGSEMLVVSDTVRLLPNSKSDQAICTDIMSIKSIRLKWSSLDKASSNDYDEGRPFNSAIWVYGSAYTSDASKSDKRWTSDTNTQLPKAASDYADFHPLHPPDKELAVPYARVAGRLYERNAMAHFLRSNHLDLDLDIGRQALVEARAFSRRNDERIAQTPDATWYWGDDRADALGLRTLNGLDVSRYNPERDVKALRKQYQVLDAANEDAKPCLDIGSTGSGRLQRFMAPALPVRSQRSDDDSAMDRKRACVSDPDSDEIRQHTRVVDNRGPPSKKAKVMVVID